MQQLQPGQIRFRLLFSTEFHGQQLDADLFREPNQALLVSQHNRHHRHKAELFHDAIEPVPLQHMVQLMAQDTRHLFAAFRFIQQSGEDDDEIETPAEMYYLPEYSRCQYWLALFIGGFSMLLGAMFCLSSPIA